MIRNLGSPTIPIYERCAGILGLVELMLRARTAQEIYFVLYGEAVVVIKLVVSFIFVSFVSNHFDKSTRRNVFESHLCRKT